jgi:chemotaxis protein MotB
MPEPSAQPIIVIKKKGGHGGHHGGAWKVAYADFVTAMMALFIVLWLMHASPEVQKAVGGYFKDPAGTASQTGTNVAGVGAGMTLDKKNIEHLKEKLQKAVQQNPEFEKLKNNVEITVTGEGLRIELVESEKGLFFESGQPAPTGTGKDLLAKLAQELGRIDSPVALEGHTDSRPYDAEGYTNWELSADRANAARRIMQNSGLKATQVSQVRGFADQRLRLRDKPTDASNRRISIIVQYHPTAAAEEKEAKTEGHGGKASAEGKNEKAEAGKPAGHDSSEKGHEAKAESAQKKPEDKAESHEAKEPAPGKNEKAETSKPAAHDGSDKGHEAKADPGAKKHES